METKSLIEKEKQRLFKIFSGLPQNKIDTVSGLIDNAAFMLVQMQFMQERINEEGVTIKYQNGENQWGYKKSPDVETYNSFIKQYTTIIKQLVDLLPPEVAKNVEQEIREYM